MYLRLPGAHGRESQGCMSSRDDVVAKATRTGVHKIVTLVNFWAQLRVSAAQDDERPRL